MLGRKASTTRKSAAMPVRGLRRIAITRVAWGVTMECGVHGEPVPLSSSGEYVRVNTTMCLFLVTMLYSSLATAARQKFTNCTLYILWIGAILGDP